MQAVLPLYPAEHTFAQSTFYSTPWTLTWRQASCFLGLRPSSAQLCPALPCSNMAIALLFKHLASLQTSVLEDLLWASLMLSGSHLMDDNIFLRFIRDKSTGSLSLSLTVLHTEEFLRGRLATLNASIVRIPDFVWWTRGYQASEDHMLKLLEAPSALVSYERLLSRPFYVDADMPPLPTWLLHIHVVLAEARLFLKSYDNASRSIFWLIRALANIFSTDMPQPCNEDNMLDMSSLPLTISPSNL
jgi:hypothetical protein